MKLPRFARRLLLWALDVACVMASLYISLTMRFGQIGLSGAESRVGDYIVLTLLLLVTFLNFAVHRNRGFMKRTGSQEFGVVLSYNVWLLVGIAVLVVALHVQPSPSRLMPLYFVIVNVIIMSVMRAIAKAAARALLAGERLGASIVMVVEQGQRERIERVFDTGATYSIAGWLELADGRVSGTVADKDVTSEIEALPEALGDTRVDDVFVFAPTAPEQETSALLDAAERMGSNCHVALALPDPSLQGACLDLFGGFPTVSYSGRGSRFYLVFLKRLIDIVVSLLVIVVAFIPGVILAIVIALQSKGAPFYSQERLGLGGKHFKLLKFRSMVADANDVEKYFTPEQLREWQTERKLDNDPRVTGIGRFLRKTSLDEFPQFINVFKGDMSIVGPRPIVDEEISHYGDRASEFLSCKPGITGWWQVEARNDADYASGRRQALELYYVRHASATLDWNIFKRTFGAVFHGTGK